jgi:ferredoxin/flavodoxin---NADP+ reductase
MYPVVERKRLCPGVVLIKIQAPEIARKHRPGQFVMLRVDAVGERIPLTVADKDPAGGTITLIFQEVGKTTYQLARVPAGGALQDLVGPLGSATEIEKFGTTVSIGGGIGIPLLYPITKALKEAGNHVVSIIGARTKELLVLEQEMGAISDVLKVCTDDGSYGIHGFVTAELQKMIDAKEPVHRVLGVGPVPMMRALCNLTRPYGIKTIVSLNPVMVDGTGMCGACRCEIDGETRYACVDGPEFDGHKVNFDLLMKRLAMYKGQELVSLEGFKAKGGVTPQ